MTSSRTRRSRSSSRRPRRIRTRSCSVRAGSTARAICRWRIWKRPPGLLRLRHLPTNGGGPAIIAILGNNAQVTNANGVGHAAAHQAGAAPARQFRRDPLEGVARRADARELGFDVEYYLWVGIFAPKGTPPEIVTTLRAAIGKAAHSLNSWRRSPMPARSSPISTARTSRSSGISTASEPTRR